MTPATQAVNTEQITAASVEAKVIGLLLAYPTQGKAIALPLLQLEDFTLQPLRIIFQAIKAIDESGAVFEVFAVQEILREGHMLEGAGGIKSLMNLHQFAKEPFNLERYCRILIEYRSKRKLLRLAQAITRALDQGSDVFDTLANAEQTFTSIQNGFITTEVRTLKQAGIKAMNHLFDRRDNPQQARIKFGIASLDRVAGSLEAGDVIVWAARPGVGKSDALVHFAWFNGLVNALPGIIFSLEMPDIQVAFRFLARPSGVPASAARQDVSGDELHRLATAVDQMENGDLIILNDSPSHTLSSLRAAVIQAKAKLGAGGHTLRWIALDYVQLLKGINSRSTTEEAVKEISIGLKAMAKELKVVILELAQLGRDVDTRKPPVPEKADIRASAQIEMDADLIILPYRPSFYNLDTDSQSQPIPAHELDEYVEFIVAKNRNNRPGIAIGRYLPAESRFDVFPESTYQSFPTDFTKAQNDPF